MALFANWQRSIRTPLTQSAFVRPDCSSFGNQAATRHFRGAPIVGDCGTAAVRVQKLSRKQKEKLHFALHDIPAHIPVLAPACVWQDGGFTVFLKLALVLELASQCASMVAAETIVSLVHAESRFNPYAIGVNAKGVAAPKVSDRVSAAAAARSLIARGYNIDLGLGQINSANLSWLGLSVEEAFDPCRNLAAAAKVLSSNYLSVVRSSRSKEAAVAAALSMYNTGSRSRGFDNGYVGRVYASSNIVAPMIRKELSSVVMASPERQTAPSLPAPSVQAPPFVWQTSAGAQTATLMVFGPASSKLPKGQHK